MPVSPMLNPQFSHLIELQLGIGWFPFMEIWGIDCGIGVDVSGLEVEKLYQGLASR